MGIAFLLNAKAITHTHRGNVSGANLGAPAAIRRNMFLFPCQGVLWAGESFPFPDRRQ